jgi:S-DNA-T family DNA segregation ATPase FtsK/SpoIIIE
MNKNDDLADILAQLMEITERFKTMSEKYDAHYTEIILAAREIKDTLGQSKVTLEDEAELYDQAKSFVIEYQRASTTALQRYLRIGYSRAARLMDELEKQGVVSSGGGAKPRKVLMKEEE